LNLDEKKITLRMMVKLSLVGRTEKTPRPQIQVPVEMLRVLGFTDKDFGQEVFFTLFSDNTLTIERQWGLKMKDE
jgi:hypothetical protein